MPKIKRLIAENYSDVAIVNGVFNKDKVMEEIMFKRCKRYFEDNYKSIFFDDDKKDDVFQEALITLWDIIENRRIFVEDGMLKGKKGKALSCNLTTFFMGVAKLKFLEITHKTHKHESNQEELDREVAEAFYSCDDDNDIVVVQIGIIKDCISQMSERCRQIINKFYDEGKTLDGIIEELATFESKNALKTFKYKCMENLRASANSIFDRYLITT